jgi:uncharacterized protein involved in exopolysaccharide biosynthesis
MRRVLETIFRRPLRLLLLLLVIPLVSLGVAFTMLPRMYQAQASLWALQRYTIIGSTGASSNLLDTPASTQATALTELLQTRTFALDIAHEANLAPSLHLASNVLASASMTDDALYADISKNVVVSASAYNLYTISYSNRDKTAAQAVVQLVIADFGKQSTQLSIAEGHQILGAYQTQLGNDEKVLSQAEQAESAYANAHLVEEQSTTGFQNDPQYQALHAQTVQAQTNVATDQANIASLQEQISTLGSGPNSLYQVIDGSHVLSQPISRMTTYIAVGGVALAVSLVACILYLVILIKRDRSLYTPMEVQKVAALPVLMQLPHLSNKVVPHLIEAGASTRYQTGVMKAVVANQLTNY